MSTLKSEGTQGRRRQERERQQPPIWRRIHPPTVATTYKKHIQTIGCQTAAANHVLAYRFGTVV
jgi:hypothetical protein